MNIINYTMKYTGAIILSVFIGTIYYEIMEKSIPTESNCSFIASPWTDYLAFVWGLLVINEGIKIDSNLLVMLGSTVIVEHIHQYRRK